MVKARVSVDVLVDETRRPSPAGAYCYWSVNAAAAPAVAFSHAVSRHSLWTQASWEPVWNAGNWTFSSAFPPDGGKEFRCFALAFRPSEHFGCLTVFSV